MCGPEGVALAPTIPAISGTLATTLIGLGYLATTLIGLGYLATTLIGLGYLQCYYYI